MSKMHNFKSGDKFNNLTVIKNLNKSVSKQKIWLVECDCGKQIEISASKLFCNGKRSCGCLHKNILLKRNTKHGLSKSRLYIVFKSIKNRCLNPKSKAYKNYGARGISIYKKWINRPELFVRWIDKNLGERPSAKHSLDRINNNKGYTPGNLRWADQKTQTNNSRHSLANR
jgi:hypothetical protein